MSSAARFTFRSTRAVLLALLVSLLLAGVARADTFTVDTTTDSAAPGTAANCQAGHAAGTCAVRDAVAAVDATSGGTDPSANAINIPSGNYLLSKDVEMRITKPVTITGAGARSTILDGDGSARIFVVGAATVIGGVTLTDGDASGESTGGAYGGAVLTFAPLTLNGVAVTDSIAQNGGGGIAVNRAAASVRPIAAVTGSLTAIASTIGGDPSLASTAQTDIRAGNIAFGSSGARGGGIYAGSNTQVSLTNTTVAGNIAGFSDENSPAAGGGIWLASSAQLTTLNATIAYNQSFGVGGGVSGLLPLSALHAQSQSSPFLPQNTIVANNMAPSGANCSNVGTTSQNDNLSNDSTCKFTAANDNQGADPKLDSKATNNGGPTDTVALFAGSPALDTARDTGCPNAGEGTNVDQRGVTRPQGPACDIGAYELIVPPATPSAAPQPSADLQIVKTASTPFPTVGQNVTYTLAVRNNGPSQATGVVVGDTLPAGETLVSDSPQQGTCSGNPAVTCTLGTLAVGQTSIITIVVHTTATGTITNGARVAGAQPDPNPANNSSQATISPAAVAASERSPRVTVAGVPVCVSNGAALRIHVVTGSGVRRVRVLVNGKLVMLTNHSSFVLKLSSRALRASRNVVSVRVTSRGGRNTTKTTVLRHCRVIAPRFTG